MAAPQTAKYEELVLEVEFTAESGTYVAMCGLTDVSINRTSNIDETEVPGDCNDESVPLSIEIAVRSQTVSASGSGVWALSSHENMMDWWYSGATKVARLRNLKATNDGVTGDTTVESGPAILATLNNSRTKGQKVSSEIEIRFDGVPTRTAK
tara:strand:+ start:1207 stop:1665 length:459 start_codon:yes stop_codon:yes gene_type:complete